jgi:hypothetical protein
MARMTALTYKWGACSCVWSIPAGLGTNRRVHAVGDGAAERVAELFGLCRLPGGLLPRLRLPRGHREALCARRPQRLAAAPTRAAENRPKRGSPGRSASSDGTSRTPEEAAPVRACHRHLAKRCAQLDYRAALAAGLPIGSGEIESAHRYLVQQRLKRPGAWWTADNAEVMLVLRIARANGQWHSYWTGELKQAA